MFPLTINGTVWDSPDFINGLYHQNLGPMLYDVLKDRRDRITAISSSSSTWAAGAKTFTIPTGKEFRAGQQVMIGSKTSATRGAWMSGVVTSYAAGVLSVTVATFYPETGSNALWDICVTSPATAYPGGTWASAAAARTANSVFMPTEGFTVFEDFCGWLPDNTPAQEILNIGAFGNAYSYPLQSWMGSTRLIGYGSTGDSTIVFNGNYNESLVDPDHPGIATMELVSPGTCAVFMLGRTAIFPVSGKTAEMRTCFMLEDQLESSDGNVLQFVAGYLKADPAGVFGVGPDTLANEGRPNTLDFTFISLTEIGYIATNNAGQALVDSYGNSVARNSLTAYSASTGTGIEEVPGTRLDLPSGVWLTFTAWLDSSGSMTLDVTSRDNVTYLNVTLAVAQTSANDNHVWPFFLIKKLVGTTKKKVFVDYFYVKAQSGAR